MPNPFEAQVDAAIVAYDAALAKARFDDGSDMGHAKRQELLVACLGAIERATGTNSVYYQQAHNSRGWHEFEHLANVIGICRALLSDIRNGYLHSIEEVVHAEVFSDYLEMAEHLVENGYKDAAAVISGSTLEAHIKKLCGKHGITTEAAGRPKKADALNAELSKAGAYSKLDLKNVTAWLGLRNNAAHGNYSEYDSNQVSLLISAVRNFIARLPA